MDNAAFGGNEKRAAIMEEYMPRIIIHQSQELQETPGNIQVCLSEETVRRLERIDQKIEKMEEYMPRILIHQSQGLMAKAEHIQGSTSKGTMQRLQRIEQRIVRMEEYMLSFLKNQSQVLEGKSENIQGYLPEETMQHLERIEQRVARIEDCLPNQKVNRAKQKERFDLTKEKIRQHIHDKKNVHVRSRVYDHARGTLLEHRHLVLQGKPGDGKTYTALSLIGDLMEMYQYMMPLEVNNLNEWEELVDMKEPVIVFMDDVLGKHAVFETDLRQWEKLSEYIYRTITENYAILILCFREHIALNGKRYVQESRALSWMFDSNVINLSDEDYCLTKENKKEMLRKYASKQMKHIDDVTIDSVLKMNNIIGFPQNCKIWSCRHNLELNEVCAKNMFLLEEIQDMSRNSCQHFSFLVLLMLSGGSLSLENHTEDLRCKIKKITELCGTKNELSTYQFTNIGYSLCKMFVEYDNKTKKFRFQHNCIESAVLFSFGTQYTKITLEMCSLQTVTKLSCLRNKGNTSHDTCFLNLMIIINDDSYFEVILERFRTGLETRQRELYQCIAEARVWQATRFSDYFLKSLTSADDVINFLSKQDFGEQSLMVYLIYSENTLVVKGIVEKISQFNIRDHPLISRQILLATVNSCLAEKTYICQYLVEFQDKVDDFVMFAAALTGNVSIMDTLLGHGGNLNATISDKQRKDLENTIKNCVSFPNNESYHYDINLLHIACSFGRIIMVRYLNNKCAELLYKISSIGFTAAHFAARSENVELMKLLLALGLSIERRSNIGSLLLHIAAANSNVEMVKYLTETFPQMTQQTDRKKWTVLHYSGKGGSITVLDVLLDIGLDIMARTDDGNNILHVSAMNNHLLMVTYLIKTHPDLVKQKNNIGRTALFFAAASGSVAMIDVLLQAGSDITTRDKDGTNVLHVAVLRNNFATTSYLIKTYPELKQDILNDGSTVVHCCSIRGGTSVMELLLQEGFDIKAKSKCGNNALHVVALNKNLAIVNYLTEQYPQLIQMAEENGFTALHAAAQGGEVQVIESLIKAGSDITARGNNGSNPLHIAVLTDKLYAVKYFIDNYPQLVQLKNDTFEWTSLHFACDGASVPIIEALIEAGCDSTARTINGQNLLHVAAWKNNLSVVNYLIKTFPKLKHQTDFQKCTAVHYAAREGNVQVMEVLLQAGLDITVRTNDLSNVLHIASSNDKVSVVIHLVQTCPQVVKVLAEQNNKYGLKPIHNAARSGSVCLLEVLVHAGADIKTRTQGGQSVVQIAAMNNNVSLLSYLNETFPDMTP